MANAVPRAKAGDRFRRSPALVLHWAGNQLACFVCATGQRVPVGAEVVAILNAMPDWTTGEELLARHPGLGSQGQVTRLLRTLTRLGLAERSGEAREWPWREWSPEAAFFHFGTRATSFLADPLENDRRLRRKALHDPPPPPTKSVRGPRLALPAPAPKGDLSAILHARRTWRNFGRRSVSLADAATLLQETWGVQKHGTAPGQGPVVLKTSPSAGARHSLEAYVLSLNVKGLRRGVYHYDAATHELVDTGRTVSRPQVERLLANQYYFKGAALVVVMAAVFDRSMWRYPSSRAYRTVLIDAGHLGQTFCLSATALNLAPFCTMAFLDAELERVIGVDGIREGAIYVVGAGSRPPDHLSRPGRISRKRT